MHQFHLSKSLIEAILSSDKCTEGATDPTREAREPKDPNTPKRTYKTS